MDKEIKEINAKTIVQLEPMAKQIAEVMLRRNPTPLVWPEELSNAILAALWEHPTYDPSKGKIGNYMMTIGRNALREFIRERRTTVDRVSENITSRRNDIEDAEEIIDAAGRLRKRRNGAGLNADQQRAADHVMRGLTRQKAYELIFGPPTQNPKSSAYRMKISRFFGPIDKYFQLAVKSGATRGKKISRKPAPLQRRVRRLSGRR